MILRSSENAITTFHFQSRITQYFYEDLSLRNFEKSLYIIINEYLMKKFIKRWKNTQNLEPRAYKQVNPSLPISFLHMYIGTQPAYLLAIYFGGADNGRVTVAIYKAAKLTERALSIVTEQWPRRVQNSLFGRRLILQLIVGQRKQWIFAFFKWFLMEGKGYTHICKQSRTIIFIRDNRIQKISIIFRIRRKMLYCNENMYVI